MPEQDRNLTYLILDTEVWVTLATDQFSLVAKLAWLIQEGRVAIVVPERVRREWDNLDGKVCSIIRDRVIQERRNAKNGYEFLANLNVWEAREAKHFERAATEIKRFDPEELALAEAEYRLREINSILNDDQTTHWPESGEATQQAVSFALAKKAPFRTKNSMADALIFFGAVEWAKCEDPTECVFVSGDSSFCDDRPTDEERGDSSPSLAPDLAALADAVNMAFETVLARTLKRIEESLITQEEVELGEVHARAVRLMEGFKELEHLRELGMQFESLRKELTMASSKPLGQMDRLIKEFKAPGESIRESIAQLERLMDPGKKLETIRKQLTATTSNPFDQIDRLTKEFRTTGDVLTTGTLHSTRQVLAIITDQAEGFSTEVSKAVDELKRLIPQLAAPSSPAIEDVKSTQQATLDEEE